MNRIVSNIFIFYLFVLGTSIAMTVLNACDCGTDADASVELTSSLNSKNSSSKKAYPDSFKPNDKEYPYANIPRIVIETENRTKIKDRETERLPQKKFQIDMSGSQADTNEKPLGIQQNFAPIPRIVPPGTGYKAFDMNGVYLYRGDM